MKKFILISTIVVAVALVVSLVVQVSMGIRFPGVQQLFLAIFLGLLALNHIQQKKNRDLVFWLLVAAAVLNFVVALFTMQPFS